MAVPGKSYGDYAVVLKAMRLGEADRIVTLMTAEHGKIRAVVKGVRKTSSHFGARTEITTHLRVQCWRGRDLHTLTQVEVVDAFRAVREDLDRFSQAMAMLDAVDQIAQDGQEFPALYAMLVRALAVLDSTGSPLVAPSFFWKLLALDGSSPMLSACAGCGKPESEGLLVAFDFAQGGVLCEACQRGRKLSAPGTLDLIRRILQGQLRTVLFEPLSPDAAEMSRLAVDAMEAHVGRSLRSCHTGLVQPALRDSGQVP